MFNNFFVFPKSKYSEDVKIFLLASHLVKEMSKRTYLDDKEKTHMLKCLTKKQEEAKYASLCDIYLIRKIFPMSKFYRTEKDLLFTLWTIVQTAASTGIDPLRMYVDTLGTFPGEKENELKNLRMLCVYIDNASWNQREINLEEIRGLIS